MNDSIKGRAFVIGDGVTAYKIISQARWTACGTDMAELGKWAFEPSLDEIRDVEYGFRDLGFDIVVAGGDFGGGGKTNDHPVLALMGAGVKLVVAESFNRIFFRNAINLGLPVVQCRGILSLIETGQEVSCDLRSDEVKNLTTGCSLQYVPLSELALEILSAGGLLSYHRARFAARKAAHAG